ncbi:PREDICTED: solute carrier family 22 member 18 isoform X2 [Hipposideros armiger]|uniref:Organic cation transporter-like protein 2 n=1 Tax=Hipposideros armiger TaxID=186990 RepID=A0A8B7TAV5_HIPAR|nr:PREDICTED: solute carrier family 22 member 18 isoform X2 [Hipposideros armiger]
MPGAGAPRGQGQSPAGMGPLGRPWVLLLTYTLTALELTCLFMQFSIIPYLSRILGLDSVTFGYLQTTFGVLQLLGGPVFGSPALPGVALLFASRLPAALMHTMPTAQMVITDLSTPEERPAALSRLGLCFGLGTILGSLLGGTLSAACGIHCPAIIAFVANLLGAALSFTCIPASTKAASARGQAAPPGGPKASLFDLKAIIHLLLRPGVLPVFLIKVISGFPSGLFMVMFSIICMDFFGLEPAQSGYLLSFFGLLLMITQGLVIGQLNKHFSEGALLRASVLVFCVVGLAMARMSSILHFCLLMPGLIFSLCALNVVTDSILTKAVSPSDTGTMLGLCASVQPLTRTLGPTLGGLLYRSFGVPVFGHVQFAINFLVLLALWRQPLPQKKSRVQ